MIVTAMQAGTLGLHDLTRETVVFQQPVRPCLQARTGPRCSGRFFRHGAMQPEIAGQAYPVAHNHSGERPIPDTAGMFG